MRQAHKLRSHPTLIKLFRRMNKAWFRNRLPAGTVVRFCRLNKKIVADAVPGEIRMNTRFRDCPRITEMTLLHEMVHLLLWGGGEDDHGDKFQAEMLRLAQAGAFRYCW